jgi:hypothetical protein
LKENDNLGERLKRRVWLRGWKYIVAAVVILTIIVTPIVTYDLAYNSGYNSGYSTGYNRGTIIGLERGQEEQLIQAGTTMPLQPGAYIAIPFVNGAIGIFNVSGTVGFTVTPNTTAELYVESDLGPLYNSTYVNLIDASFTFVLNGGHSTYVILKANPQNQETISIFWNSPLLLTIQPPIV